MERSTSDESEPPALGVMDDMKLTMEPFLEFSPVRALANESLSLSKTLLNTGFAAFVRLLLLRRVWVKIGTVDGVAGARGSKGSKREVGLGAEEGLVDVGGAEGRVEEN